MIAAHPGSPAFSNVFQNPTKTATVRANVMKSSMPPLPLPCNGTKEFVTDTIT
jgi:hypothetical protein